MTLSLDWKSEFVYMGLLVGQVQIFGSKVEMYMLFSMISEMRKMSPLLVPLTSDIREPKC